MGALEEGHFEAEMQAIAFGSEGGAIEDAVRVLLNGLGEDPDREELRKTPARVAKAFRDGTRGYKQKVEDIVQDALFPEAGLDNGIGQAGGAGGLVVVRDIHLFSYCESCLLPFSIQCHVGYVPSGKRVLGLSKLSRVADVYAKRLQEPNRLAHEICSALQNSITPAGVSVALQCCHIQSPHDLKFNPKPTHPSRSSMQGWVRTSASSCSGVFKDENTSLLDEFHSLLKFMGVTMGSSVHPWCPSTSLVPSLQDESISRSDSVAAVASILPLLHEDPSRKELVGTPYRYVNWLMNFRRSQLCTNTNGATDPREKINRFIYGKPEIHSELNLPFCAQCEHHLLPFHGVVHIGFFHDSKRKPMIRPWLQALVSSYGCKLQVQERLTRQIAEAVHSIFAWGVMVVAEASHMCMISRGIEQVGSSTATMAVMGQFTTDAAAKALFLGAISKSTATGGLVAHKF